MSIRTITIAVNKNIQAPEVGDGGFIGLPNILIEHNYNEEWDVNSYSFGWIYSGFNSIGLVTKCTENFREFLEKHSGDNICAFTEGDESEEEEQVDWDNLKTFEPTPKNQFKECSFQITNTKNDNFFLSKNTEMLIPNESLLSREDINNFIEKICDAEEIDDYLSYLPSIIDPYEELGNIRSFIMKNKDDQLKIIIKSL
ncbi:MAG: hypothetical protein OEM02_06970 [Desulfobulbaceae bacterium]|nr:hypothetical protein [Desulfobulbaceae bacterium]